MTLLFADSFDHYATADISKKWNAYNRATIGVTGRRGTNGLKVTDAVAGYVQKTLSSGVATLIVGFSINPYSQVTTNGCLFQYKEGATKHITARFDATGHIQFVFGTETSTTVLLTSAATFTIGTEYYIETKLTIDNTAGAIEFRVNGAADSSVSGIDTRNGGTAGLIDIFTFGTNTTYSGAGSTAYIDDFYMCDTAGSVNNTFLGDVRVDCLMPNADGTYLDGTPSTGTTHYTLVDEIPPTTSDYNALAATNNKDTYGFSALPSVGTSLIKAVQLNFALLKSDTGSRGASNVTLSGGTLDYSTTSALGTTLAFKTSINETDPNTSAAWTEAAVNAAEFGVRADA